ncbi:MAG TPA: DUF362 domain-containing protein [Terriglobia bacterium]|nr:DUF362 domain-containing protein [Terriglobia bacterium]
MTHPNIPTQSGRTTRFIAESLSFLVPRFDRDRRPARSRVAILPATEHSQKLANLLWEGLRLFNLNLAGKCVLLKPNLVDYVPRAEINTHPLLIIAAVDGFRRLGARRVVVAEGPGHQRDTQFVLRATGLARHLKEQKIPFVDLNRDEVARIRLRTDYSRLKRLWLPRTVLDADFIVSMPKVKTHHWAGVTLSMKNMFGVVPGIKYGWPKNLLHWRGIQQCIVDLAATVPIHFVIADAIVCMEGNGPLAGTSRRLDRIVLSDDSVAADATCTRLMGFVPECIPHIAEAAKFLGNKAPERIDQLALQVISPAVSFRTVLEFEHLRATAGSSWAAGS